LKGKPILPETLLHPPRAPDANDVGGVRLRRRGRPRGRALREADSRHERGGERDRGHGFGVARDSSRKTDGHAPAVLSSVLADLLPPPPARERETSSLATARGQEEQAGEEEEGLEIFLGSLPRCWSLTNNFSRLGSILFLAAKSLPSSSFSFSFACVWPRAPAARVAYSPDAGVERVGPVVRPSARATGPGDQNTGGREKKRKEGNQSRGEVLAVVRPGGGAGLLVRPDAGEARAGRADVD